MLKQVTMTINNIHKWTNKYLGAPTILPTKCWITDQNDKVHIHIKFQSWDKLARDVDMVLASYRRLLSGLEYVIEVHRVPSIVAIREMRRQEEVLHDIQEFCNPFRQHSTTDNLQVMKETITQYVAEPMRIDTKFFTLSNHIKVKKSTLILDALKFLHRHDEEQQKVVTVPVEYKLWCTYLVEQLHLDVPELYITKLLEYDQFCFAQKDRIEQSLVGM